MSEERQSVVRSPQSVVGPVLALDSSAGGGSVAVAVDGRLAAEVVLEAGRGASSLLLPAVDRAVREAGIGPRDLAAVVAAGGPGSFTGLRIAAATAKAIVRSLGVPLFAYSGLMAAAAAHRRSGGTVCALFDARNREVFAGCWSFHGEGVDEVMTPAALSVDEVVARLKGMPTTDDGLRTTDYGLRTADFPPRFTGDGAALHRAEIEAAFGADAVLDPAPESPAAALLWLARTVPDAGRVAQPAAWEPEYLRAPGAERIAAARSG